MAETNFFDEMEPTGMMIMIIIKAAGAPHLLARGKTFNRARFRKSDLSGVAGVFFNQLLLQTFEDALH